MNKKITSSALAALMIAGTTSFTAFAAMSNGTVVIGNKAFDLNYANNSANAEEITDLVVAGGMIFVKDFDGNWIDNTTGQAVNASVIPAVVYKGIDNKEVKFDNGDKDAVNTLLVASATPINATATVGDTYVLPTTVSVALSDKSNKDLAVTWDKVADTKIAGTYTFTGTLTVVDGVENTGNVTVTATLTVNPVAALTVESVNAINATQVEVKFTKAIDEDSLFSDVTNGTFKASTVAINSIDGMVNGTLIGSLSADGLTLTVTSTKALSKRYNVVVNNLLSKDAKSLIKYDEIVNFSADITAPKIVSTTKISAGTFKVTFSEPLSTEGTISYKLADGTVVSNTVGTGVNYTISADKKEITFTVGSEVPVNKQVIATFVGTQDMALNLLTPNPAIASFTKGDKDGVAPTVTSISQTGATTFAVKFSEELISTPHVTVANFASIAKDTTDPTKYIVTTSLPLDGVTDITVDTFADLSGEAGTTTGKIVTFVKDTVAPKVVSSVVSIDSTDKKEYLEITFDKDVTLAAPTVDVTSGSYVKDYITTNILDADITAKPVAYKTVTNKKIVRVALASLLTGKDVKGATYSLNLAFANITSGAAIAADTAKTDFTRGEDGVATSTDIAAVTLIAPGTDNNKVEVTFDKAVDGASAINVNNYKVDGAVIESVTLLPASGTQVAVLNLKANSNTFTGVRNISVANVQALGSSKVMVPYTTNTVSLKENVAATVTSAKLTNTTTITLTFSEAVKDGLADDFEVLVGGKSIATPKLVTTGVGATASTTATITITAVDADVLSKGITLKYLTTNDVVDLAGNKLSVPSNIIITQ